MKDLFSIHLNNDCFIYIHLCLITEIFIVNLNILKTSKVNQVAMSWLYMLFDFFLLRQD